MKTIELRAKTGAELDQELSSLLRAQFSLRMQKATQQITNTNPLRILRRDIARVRTLITEKASQK